MSYEALPAAVGAVVDALHRAGARPGDRIAVALDNCVTAVESFLACAALGGIWVGINPTAPASERGRQLEQVRPRLLIAQTSDGVPPGIEVLDPADLIARPSPGASAVDVGSRPDPRQPCAIAFTSGTTGTPKAIVHSRAAVSLTAASVARASVRADDRRGVCLPLSIHNVMIVGPLAALTAGATTVLLEKMHAAAVAAACAQLELTTVAALVPATVFDLAYRDDIARDALKSLRVAGTGGAGLPETVRRAFEAKFHVRLAGSYGLSEAPAVVCLEDPSNPHAEGSSGVPLLHVSVEVREVDGAPVAAGVHGQIWVGPAETGPWAGLHRPAIGTWTEAGWIPRTDHDPWWSTGDIGCLDANGALHVAARTSDVIVRGGVNVTTAELEAVIGDIPGVRHAAVLGRPDRRLGQQIIAFVELDDHDAGVDADSLRRHAQTLLSHGKVPDHFVILDALPRNAMGKVRQADLIDHWGADSMPE